MNYPETSLRLQILCGQPINVWRDRVIGMWVTEGVISQKEAERRVHEVIYALLDDKDEAVGVTTAYPGHITLFAEPVWFLRMFIRKSARKALGLKNHSAFQWEAFDKTCQFLAQNNRAAHRGVVMVTENRKLWSERWQKRLGERGWQVLGKDAGGHVIFFLPFQK